MSQMGEKGLEVLVNGELIGEVTMKKLSNYTTLVEGDIISNGHYSMSPKDVKEMIYRRVRRDYPTGNIEIKEE